jgi:hypothetical protein
VFYLLIITPKCLGLSFWPYNHTCRLFATSGGIKTQEAPWRWPTVTAEGCRSNNYQTKALCNKSRVKYRVFNLKVDRQLSREYFTSDAIYNGSAGMTLYYYMCRSWQDCCRRGENQSWPSLSVESVHSESWCLNNAIFYAFITRLTVEECVFILESHLKTTP